MGFSLSGIPPLTCYAALFALGSGITGLIIAWCRAGWLYRGEAMLRRARDWGALASLRGTAGFRNAITRLTELRKRVSGEPEDAWRATFDLVISCEEAWEGLVRSLSSIAVLTGLAGTVMGFLQLAAVPGSSGHGGVDVTQLSKLFTATICGVVGSLAILLLGLPPLRWAMETWANAVESAGRLILLPELPRPPTRLPAAIQNAILAQLTGRLEAIATAWRVSLAKPASSLEGLVSSAATSVREIQRALESVKISAEDLRDFAASARQIKAAATAMTKSAQGYVAASGDLSNAATGFQKTLGDLSETVRDSTVRVGGVEEAITKAQTEFASQGRSATEAIKDMAANFSGLRGIISDRMREEAAVANGALDAVEHLNSSVSSLNKMQGALAGASDRMSLAAGALSGAADEALGRLPEKLSEVVSNSLNRTEHNEQLFLNGIKEQLDRAGSKSAEAADKLARSSDRIASSIAHFTGRARSLNDTAEPAQNKMPGLSEGLDTISSRMTEKMEENLGNLLERLSTQLREVLQPRRSEQEQNSPTLVEELACATEAMKTVAEELRKALQVFGAKSPVSMPTDSAEAPRGAVNSSASPNQPGTRNETDGPRGQSGRAKKVADYIPIGIIAVTMAVLFAGV